MSSIILGVFYTRYWGKIMEETNSDEFPFNSIDYYKNWSSSGIVDIYIRPVSIVVDCINFLLDNLYLPLTVDSITCKELMYVISEPDILVKTQFWLGGQKVNTNLVLKAIEAATTQQLLFNNLDLKTFL